MQDLMFWYIKKLNAIELLIKYTKIHAFTKKLEIQVFKKI